MKMKKITVILVLVVAMVGLFASCEKECTCEHSYVLGKQSILGKWKVVSKTCTGTPYSWLESLEFQEGGIVKVVKCGFYYGTVTSTRSWYGTFAINDSILIAGEVVYKIASLDANELNLIGTTENIDQDHADMEIRYQLKKE